MWRSRQGGCPHSKAIGTGRRLERIADFILNGYATRRGAQISPLTDRVWSMGASFRYSLLLASG